MLSNILEKFGSLNRILLPAINAPMQSELNIFNSFPAKIMFQFLLRSRRY